MARPLARHQQSTGLLVSGLGLSHSLRSARPAGQKVLTLQGAERGHGTAPAGGPVPREGLALASAIAGCKACPRQAGFKQDLCVDIDGFSLHAAVRCGADDRQALEQLCVAASPVGHWSTNRCNAPSAAGQVVPKLKTPWRDGTTHLVMSP